MGTVRGGFSRAWLLGGGGLSRGFRGGLGGYVKTLSRITPIPFESGFGHQRMPVVEANVRPWHAVLPRGLQGDSSAKFG